MSKISINITTLAPEPKDEYRSLSLLDKIDEFILRVDSTDTDTWYEYNYLKRLYEKLITYPLTPELYERMLRLEDLFAKYADKDVDGEVDLDGELMLKGGF